VADESLAVGLAVGLALGVVIGLLVAQLISAQRPVSVVFDRDAEGRVVAIHYVPR
jgi:uncharacterized membrane-anchored protein YhcB (DUF1043 family)